MTVVVLKKTNRASSTRGTNLGTPHHHLPKGATAQTTINKIQRYPSSTITSNGSLSMLWLSSSQCHELNPSWHKSDTTLARMQVEKMFRGSALEDRTSSYAKFSNHEMELGKLLGRGSFGTVHEIVKLHLNQVQTTAVHPVAVDQEDHHYHKGQEDQVGIQDKQVQEQHDDNTYKNNLEGRQFLAQHCTRSTGEARYAIKCLNADIMLDRSRYAEGVANMVIEARILSVIEHPNIIKLRGIADTNLYCQPGFFIILDRLYDTLEKRIDQWNRTNRQGFLYNLLTNRKGTKKRSLQEKRLVVAFDLSAALDYLHQHQILHRDLKPENIGFDIRDDAKLFDFSLATDLHSKVPNADGTYALTGMTGSLRYMAPEVALEKPYNASSDVYSFAILFWEMYSLQRPFGTVTPSVFLSMVAQGNTRPEVPTSWPACIKIMLKRCWSPNRKERMTMNEVSSILKQKVTQLRDGDDTGLDHTRRRSTFVFRRSSLKKT